MPLRLARALLFTLASTGSAAAQSTSVPISTPPTPLLPESFGEWKQAGAGAAVIASTPLAALSKQALGECGPERSLVADYTRNGRTIHAEAIEFGDRSGAFSAFTLAERPGMKPGKDLGSLNAVGPDALLFTTGATIVLLSGATAADLPSLQPLAAGLPKVTGNKGVAPLLPTMAPGKGLVNGSLRYALGPATYAAEGGVLPAQSLGWDKKAEAVTAQLEDKRGKETVTLLLYPTPTIAGKFTKAITDALPSMGPAFASAKVRREGELVLLSNGTFAPDEAQKLIENIHMRQELSFDKDVQPVFHVEVQKTFTLLQNIAIFSGIGATAAVLLGLFLGFGRAWFRVLRGKPAATEPEFLSLHLAPQNKSPDFK